MPRTKTSKPVLDFVVTAHHKYIIIIVSLIKLFFWKGEAAVPDDVETVYCIFLNAKNRILAIEKMFSGTISASAIYPRELIKRILALKSSAIVLTHNHPSGFVEPSAEDKAITIRMTIALESIDVTLHDHIIIGDGYHSMADSGWLNGVGKRFKDLLLEKS